MKINGQNGLPKAYLGISCPTFFKKNRNITQRVYKEFPNFANEVTDPKKSRNLPDKVGQVGGELGNHSQIVLTDNKNFVQCVSQSMFAVCALAWATLDHHP